jgi:hypothetical protein
LAKPKKPNSLPVLLLLLLLLLQSICVGTWTRLT